MVVVRGSGEGRCGWGRGVLAVPVTRGRCRGGRRVRVVGVVVVLLHAFLRRRPVRKES
jgi:hypothetical protein